MHEFDRADTLREREISIDRTFSRNGGPVAAKPDQRHVWPKPPLVRLPKRESKPGVQLRQIGPGRAVRPEKTRTPWLRTVSDMPKFQVEIAKPVGHATKLPDRIRDRNFIPWRHQREMNVGGGDEANRISLQFPRHPREFVGDLRRNLERDENTRRPRTA